MSSESDGEGKTGHVVDELLDYLAGHPSDKRIAEIEAHLRACEDCANDFEWARDFQRRVAEKSLVHLTPARLVSIAEDGRGNLTEREREHLSACPHCGHELDLAESLPEIPTSRTSVWSRLVERVRGLFQSHPLVAWGGVGIALVAFLATLLVLPPGPDERIVRLARIEPLQIPIQRDRPSTPFDIARVHYRSGRYAEAAETLSEVGPEARDSEYLILLGSIQLLTGQKKTAVATLGRAAEIARRDAESEEALWQLANAELASGQAARAESALVRVVAFAGVRKDAAGKTLELLRQLRE